MIIISWQFYHELVALQAKLESPVMAGPNFNSMQGRGAGAGTSHGSQMGINPYANRGPQVGASRIASINQKQKFFLIVLSAFLSSISARLQYNDRSGTKPIDNHE